VSVVCCNCSEKARQQGRKIEDWNFEREGQCLYLFTNKGVVDEYLAKGAYLFAPGKLDKWQESLRIQGFDQETARAFYAETITKLVLLDTQVNPRSAELIKGVAEYLNLPYEVLPVGLDVFRVQLENMVLKWRARSQLLPSNDSASTNHVSQQLAAYAMTLDVLGRLTGIMTEEQAIESTMDLFSMLFAPRQVIYYPVFGVKFGEIKSSPSQSLSDDLVAERLKWINQPQDWTEIEDGFLLRIRYQNETVGMIEIDGLAFPEYRSRYLNLALGVARVCALSISNARAFQKLLSSHKLTEIGTLAAGVSHEINSPLQVIIGTGEVLLESLQSEGCNVEEVCRKLNVLNRNAWRVSKIVNSLLVYAQASPTKTEKQDLNEIIRDAMLLIESQAEAWKDIAINTHLADDLPQLMCDRNGITQVILNLFSNAHDALWEGGEISIATAYDAKSDQIELTISDNGEGIAGEILDKIFNPFFTTRPLGKGVGLGLSIVQGIVRAHGGEVQVASKLGLGTRVTINFPLNVEVKLADTQNAEGIPRGRFDEIVR